MRHRNEDAMVDSYSRAGFLAVMGGPRHKNKQGFMSRISEEWAYLQWCKLTGCDPKDVQSAVDYEGEVGWLYLDEPQEDHR